MQKSYQYLTVDTWKAARAPIKPKDDVQELKAACQKTHINRQIKIKLEKHDQTRQRHRGMISITTNMSRHALVLESIISVARWSNNMTNLQLVLENNFIMHMKSIENTH
jgi:methyltransferase-like protein